MACDNTTPDTGLTDTFISIEHGQLPQWWISPAITLNGLSGGAVANPSPTNNVTDVTFHSSVAGNNIGQGAGSILVDVYVCIAGLAMNPSDTAKVKKLGSKSIPLTFGANSDTSFPTGQKLNWVASTNSSDPDGPGHKCLVAVAYPDSLSPDPSCFHQAGGPNQADQHYAQLNIAIEPIPSGERGRRLFFGTFTINPDRMAAAPATLRAEADISPNQKLIDILTPTLNATGAYKRVARRGPQSFVLQLPDFPNAVVRDKTRWGCLGFFFCILSWFGITFRPSYEADIRLQPGQTATINFQADLANSSPGDAHIFHLTHVRPDGRSIGGLTLVGVVV
jgi:hypothetical protein